MRRLRIVVGGFIGLLPAGGVTWDYVQYPAGFAALGHDVYYIEDTRLWPQYTRDVSDCVPLVEHLSKVMADFDLANRWAYRDEASQMCLGMTSSRIADVCRSADLFVNVSCSTFLRDEYRAIPVRVLIDTDPMFTQMQFELQQAFTPGKGGMRDLVAGHTHHFTFGENVGQADCRLPSCGVTWRPTRQPVLLDKWSAKEPPPGAAVTTLMNWIAARPVEYAGTTWRQKDVEFQNVLDLPARFPDHSMAVVVGQTMGIPFPAEQTRAKGWHVLLPEQCANDWRAYRDFLVGSAAEFSVAKETYVKARTGWFSCRSACYLAASRPVVAQDTGWSRNYPTGEGLFAFSDLESAAEALGRVVAEPARHQRAARRIATDFFDARRVLGRLIEEIGLS
jgi:hypothetical protein